MEAIVVERKEFLLFSTDFHDCSLVAMMEKTKKKTMKEFVSKDCGTWLVVALRKFTAEGTFKGHMSKVV